MGAVLVMQCLARVKAQLMTAAPRVLPSSCTTVSVMTLVLLSCSRHVSRCPLVLAFYHHPFKVMN